MSGLASAIGRNRGRIAIALVLAVWLYFVIAFAEQAWRANELQAEVDAQRDAIAEMDRENAELETELDRMSSAAYYDYVQEIARRELGLANPGETVYLVRWNPEQSIAANPTPEPVAEEDQPNWERWIEVLVGE